VIPKRGKPYLICHIIDTVYLNDPETKAHFDLKVYKTWREMLELEKKAFASYHVVLMDISEKGLASPGIARGLRLGRLCEIVRLRGQFQRGCSPRAHRGLFPSGLSTSIKGG
jgi:hypothetical protein